MPLIERWNRFFFAPRDPADLAICRVLFCAGMVLHLSINHYWHWATVAHVFYRRTWLFRALGLSIVSEQWLKIFQFSALGLFILATLGLLTRISLALALPLILYLFALPSSFGKTGHGDAILVLITLVLAISRCDEALSLEHHFFEKRGRPQGREPSGEYTWPLQLCRILLALVFFGAGVTKLRRSGLDWITTDNFANLITQHQHLSHRPLTNWGLVIARHAWFYKPLAAATIAGEILFPLALINRNARRILVPIASLTQILIGLTIGVWFVQFLLCYLFFLPWTRLLSPLQSRQREQHIIEPSNAR